MYAHRVLWALHYGDTPHQQIDHANGVPYDNRISNLRLATRSENAMNKMASCRNTSGAKGVYWRKRTQKWVPRITVSGKEVYLGVFNTFEEAVEARRAAAGKYHGAFANHG